jgi:hypothetical protein
MIERGLGSLAWSRDHIICQNYEKIVNVFYFGSEVFYVPPTDAPGEGTMPSSRDVIELQNKLSLVNAVTGKVKRYFTFPVNEADGWLKNKPGFGGTTAQLANYVEA